MDGEHIEMCLNRSIPPKLREAAIIELANMREELYVLRQLASGLTQRAPDVCPVCDGTGYKRISPTMLADCRECNSTGQRG